MPGTFVLIGLNAPRYSTGASGLRSNVSMWDGPPFKLMKIAEVAFAPFTSPAAAMRRKPESDRPAPTAPTLRKSRRVAPSHVREIAIVNSFEIAGNDLV